MESMIYKLISKELDYFNLTIESRFGINLSKKKEVKIVHLLPPKPKIKNIKKIKKIPAIFDFIENKRIFLESEVYDEKYIKIDKYLINKKLNIVEFKLINNIKTSKLDIEDCEWCIEHGFDYDF